MITMWDTGPDIHRRTAPAMQPDALSSSSAMGTGGANMATFRTPSKEARWAKVLATLRAMERDQDFLEHLEREATMSEYGDEAEACLRHKGMRLH
jgi:hypothetical protein